MQNEFFIEKVKSLIAGLPAARKDPLEILKKTMNRWKVNNTWKEMEIMEISEMETWENYELIE